VLVKARIATVHDVPAAVQLVTEGSAAIAGERGGRLFLAREGVTLPVEETLDRYLSDPDSCVAVGTVDEVPSGIALARVESLSGAGTLARLEFLWVDTSFRELGVGASLAELISCWARDGGAHDLDAYALPGNREAKNLLESAGFSARLIVMTRRLGPPRD
jgi:GNAT superfamily N-acetyltransferase